jgi:hypothetical protein
MSETVADFIQLSLGREIEMLAGTVVEPDYRPFSADRLLDPDWVKRESQTDAPVLAGPVYRLRRRSGLVHMRSFLATCQRLERGHREGQRPQIEARTIREVGPGYDRETPFLELNPGWFAFVSRENRFFDDWQRSSAADARVFEHWAFPTSRITRSAVDGISPSSLSRSRRRPSGCSPAKMCPYIA